jgi:sialate O-acetylesterase
MNPRLAESAPIRWLLVAICSTAILGSLPPAFGQTGADTPPAVALGAPFNDLAVLQQGTEVPVWGWSKPGTEVTVEFAGQKSSATAGDDGKWMVKLAPLTASAEGRPMTITEKGGKSRTLKDLLVGEVWMASGQSNMQWIASKSSAALLLKQIKDQAGENGKMPLIREFKVTNRFAHLHPIEHAQGSWSEDHGNFSAVAFAFAHKLYQEIGVPIGILNCSFSETSIQAWTPRHGIKNSDLPHNKSLTSRLLETDPATPEHKTAWDAFYQNFMDAVKHNQKVAETGEGQIIELPTKTPGNMNGNRDATWLYNARIHPVVPYALRGCIWNQGYANMNGGIAYYDNLHALIPGWRAAWGMPDLPVYFHQFYSPGNDIAQSPNHPVVGGTAEMRLGTWMARDIPHTGMASQIDIQGAIHYYHKTVPGQRLALHALKNQYAKNVVTDGPMFRGYEVKGKDLIVSFDHAEGGLVVADPTYHAVGRHPDSTGFANPNIIENGAEQVRLFYLAGEDRVWHPASVRIDGEKAIVSSPAVPKPRGVSYGTGGVGFQPNLYNKALLPTTPFMFYDNEVVLESSWPDAPIKIAGVEIDPSTVGLLNEYRKMPILSSQFVDNAVLQAGKPITFWGSAIHDWGYHAKGEAVIHFEFDGTKKTIPVVNGMKEWSVTLPAFEASDKPRTLTVRFTIDGELAHERIIKNIVFGDVWYVAGIGNQEIGKMEDPVTGPIRIMTRMAKGFLADNPRTYTVSTSSTPLNRFASYWSEPTNDGFAANLAKAIHAKTGKPVGIIFMDAKDLQLKHWMDVPSLAKAPSLKADYENLAAITPGTPFYQKNAERYVADWKKYWTDFIPEMIATKAVPDDSAWGSFPNFASAVTTEATQTFNVLVASFRNTQVKGIVFMTEPSMFASDEGTNFGNEFSALANGWKRHFKNEKDPHFIHTIPAKSLAPKVTKPAIDGASSAVEITAWPEPLTKGKKPNDEVPAANQVLIDTILKTAY